MRAVALLLLLCMVALLVQQGDAWGRRRRRWFRVRIRVRRIVRRVYRPIRRIVRRVYRPIRRLIRRPFRHIRRLIRRPFRHIRKLIRRPFRHITRQLRRWRNIARRLRRKLRRFSRTFRRFGRVFRVRFRFRRIKRLVKKLAKPGLSFARKISGLARKAGSLYWLEKILSKKRQGIEGDEGRDGQPPDWTNEYTPPPSLPMPTPEVSTEPQVGPDCPAYGKPGLDQSDFVANGDVSKLTPTGAGNTTEAQSAFKYSGVDLSNELINQDIDAIIEKKNMDCFLQVAFENKIQPSLIAAIASRDTRVGKTIKSQNGYDKLYQNYGIIKCNPLLSGLGRQCYAYPWEDCNHVNMMIAGVLFPRLKQVRLLRPLWPKHQQLQGAVAAMNYGVKGLKSWSNIDSGTTGGDYSNDVIARAQHLIRCYQL